MPEHAGQVCMDVDEEAVFLLCELQEFFPSQGFQLLEGDRGRAVNAPLPRGQSASPP